MDALLEWFETGESCYNCGCEVCECERCPDCGGVIGEQGNGVIVGDELIECERCQRIDE